jgi:hypothetical protein
MPMIVCFKRRALQIVLVAVFGIVTLYSGKTNQAMAQIEVAPAPVFFRNLNDVPLMPGLRELIEQTTIFDKPEGRIVEVMAAADSLSQAAVASFYAQSLPPVGWDRIGENSYRRGAERLSLTFSDSGGQNFVRFTLVPYP